MALVNPHGGGDLNPLLLEGAALKTELDKAKKLPQIKVSSREKGEKAQGKTTLEIVEAA